MKLKFKFLIIFLIVLPCFPSWSETFSFDILVESNGLLYKKFTDIPFTGEISGRESGTVKGGKREGLWKRYYETGQLKNTQNYENGRSEFQWKKIYEDEQGKSIFLDTINIRKHEGLIYVWEIVNYWSDGKQKSLKTYTETDCKFSRWRSLDLQFFDQPMGRGLSRMNNTKPDDNWNYVNKTRPELASTKVNSAICD